MLYAKRIVQMSVAVLLKTALILGQATTPVPKLSVGDIAPGLEGLKLLQAPAGIAIDANALKDTVVVIEFWATWCAPCVAAIPHFNELMEKFKDKPVRFISISNEEEALVSSFTNRRNMRTLVGLDTTQAIGKAYAVESFPTTIVIDRDGRVAAITGPKKITEAMVNTLLERKALAVARRDIPAPVVAPTPAPKTDEIPARFAISIKPSSSHDHGLSVRPGIFRGDSVQLRRALSAIHGIPANRIVLPPALESVYWDIHGSMTEGNKEELKAIVGKAIEASLGFTVRRELRELDVIVLSAPGQNDVKLRPSSAQTPHTSEHESDDEDVGVFAGSGAPMDGLVAQLSALSQSLVVDETNLRGKYDWDVTYDKRKKRDAIIDALRELGLALTPGKRKVEVLVVEEK